MTKSYLELIEIPDYDSRLEYLLLNGFVGEPTFGSKRYLNQKFYNSYEWQKFRRRIIIRDQGCDLAHPDYPLSEGNKLLIHHINPITIDDIVNRNPMVLDPNNVVCVSHMAHEAIHFGDVKLIKDMRPADRKPNDTIPWR